MMGYPVAVSADTTANTTNPSSTNTSATNSSNNKDSEASQTSSSTTPTTVATSAEPTTNQSNKPTPATTTTASTNSSSAATSGNATVDNNGSAGNATSGNASATTSTVNSAQSTTGLSTASTFTTSVSGDQTNDVSIPDPGVITATDQTPNGLQVNSDANGQIINNINTDAKSGDATVNNNGTAGNATTGNANATANVVNVLDSTVQANKTFVGTINIYGNLDGNIVLPADSLTDMIPSNSVPIANASTTSQDDISNNVSTSATSGNATVDNNGSAGNATSGNANTNINTLNTSGENFVGTDAIAVFVNVLGSWLGYIVGAPTGSTSAMLGSDGQATANSNPATGQLTDTSTASITNNVAVNATTGDANVTNNGTAGNATSGNASASANILNMANDNLSLSGWFGVLFINVFGTWDGNVTVESPTNVDTSNTNTSTNNTSSAVTTAQNSTNTPPTNTPQTAVLADETMTPAPNESTPTQQNISVSSPQNGVLGASTTRAIIPLTHSSNSRWHFAAAGVGLSALLAIGDLLIARRKMHA